MSSNLQAALEYAEMGFRVFPCLAGDKVPAVPHGVLEATDKLEQIEAWWAAHPQWNVAIATDGYLVVDVDPAGKSWLHEIDQDSLCRGSMAVTPRGGCHYWFGQNGTELRNTASKVHEGVDTRANGGYVLVPPSEVGSKAYQWLEPLARVQPPAPHWLLKLLDVRQPIRESVSEKIPVGSRNQTLMRFAGYLRRAGLVEDEICGTLGVLNESRCQPLLGIHELRQMARSAARYEPDFIQESILLDHFQDDNAPENMVVEPEVSFPAWCIDAMPAVMREAYDHILETAIKPQSELTLGALIALFGAALGRRVEDDYRTRTNVMVLAIAPSGAGKEHPRQINKLLMDAAGMQMVNGPERIGSHAGIVSAVHAHPVRLFQLDEIGRLLMTMRDPKVSHLYNVGTVLMALYSSACTRWTGDAYADTARVKEINQPHVCIYGTSVPENLYGGLSVENLTDGLVGRLIVFESKEVPPRRKPAKRDLPGSVIDWLARWHGNAPIAEDLDTAEIGKPKRQRGNLSDENPTPRRIDKTDEANARHETYCDQVNDKHRGEDNICAAVWSRAPEKAAKLALIYACADGQSKITLEAENWGIALANYSTRLVIQAARNAVAGSKYESNMKRVFAAVKDGCTVRELTRRTQWLRRAERVEIVTDLEASGAIKKETIETDGRSKMVIRKLREVL